MATTTKYLLVEIAGDVWTIRNKRPFDSKETAWDWADSHYKKDEDRLRFYLFPIKVAV